MLFEVHARGINLEKSNHREAIDQAFSSSIQLYRRALVKLSVVIDRHDVEGTSTYECRAAVDLFGRPSFQVEARSGAFKETIDQAAEKLLASLASTFEKP